MKFKFTCELCRKEVKRGRKFNVEIFEAECEIIANGHASADDICTSCANKLTNKINSMRAKANAKK